MDYFQSWFAEHGGSFHPQVVLQSQGPFGVSVLAPRLGEDTTIVTCPFSLIITKDVSSKALRSLLGPDTHAMLETWSERQLICAYLSLHHLCPEPSSPELRVLHHLPYVQSLPPPADLLTPLQFTMAERELLRGTNLYGATLDRKRDWRVEWAQCRSVVQAVSPAWGDAFTWDMYLTASTHLSSRAFPSSILSPNPSLVASPSTYPVLIPGVDLLNHKRGQPVSWIVSCRDAAHNTTQPDTVSIIVHPKSESSFETISPHGELIEVFNNYGPKSNEEFILGYGFSLPDNPDDTITLRVGGTPTSQKWVVGRHAHTVEGLWCEIRGMVANGQSDDDFEDELETAAVLSDMVQAKLDGMRTMADVRQSGAIRPTVRAMLEHYITGQREILESILEFSKDKQKAAVETARKQGIDLVFDEDEDNGD